MKKIKYIICALLLGFSLIHAQPPIPRHGSRWVVDEANIIDQSTEETITVLLRQHADSTSNQVIVYTFNSLEGSTIEQYSNEVFNAWEIGQKGTNNGVLLAIALDDRKMRIEVGYGLEPYLTDIEAKDIIDNEIRPEFKKGNYNAGVLNGVQAILVAIQGTYEPEKSGKSSIGGSICSILFFLIFFGIVVLVMVLKMARFGGRGFGSGWSGGSSWGGGGSGWSGGGGGFSGGGGSSGGGGASGGW